jgi:hypothetical protein
MRWAIITAFISFMMIKNAATFPAGKEKFECSEMHFWQHRNNFFLSFFLSVGSDILIPGEHMAFEFKKLVIPALCSWISMCKF